MDIQNVFLSPLNLGPINRTGNGYQIGCLHGSSEEDIQGVEATPAQNLPPGIFHYASAAVFYERNILPLNPVVVAWGEAHALRIPQHPPYPVSRYTPTVDRLADDLLPAIALSGDNTIELEAIPIDLTVQQEIRSFFEHREMVLGPRDTPLLWRAIQGVDREGYERLFNRARDLGVSIIGGGLTIVQAEATIRRPDFRDRPDLQALAARWVTITMQQAAADFLRHNPGNRLHLFGGCGHIRRQATAVDRQRRRNYGENFVRYLGNRYVAVNLIYPHPSANCCTEGLLRTPRTGVNTREDSPLTFTAFFPGN